MKNVHVNMSRWGDYQRFSFCIYDFHIFHVFHSCNKRVCFHFGCSTTTDSFQGPPPPALSDPQMSQLIRKLGASSFGAGGKFTSYHSWTVHKTNILALSPNYRDSLFSLLFQAMSMLAWEPTLLFIESLLHE